MGTGLRAVSISSDSGAIAHHHSQAPRPPHVVPAIVARGMRWVLGIVLFALASSTAAAQRNPLIQRGQGEYDELRYEEALQTLSAALGRSGISHNARPRISRMRAFTCLALNREEEAAGAYRYMLPLAQDFVPGEDDSPRVREFFERVRTQWESEGRPGTGPPPPIEI